MTARIPFDPQRFGNIYRAMMGLKAGVQAANLEPALLEFVKLRASQLNGCGYCIDMHTKDARNEGETEQRLYLLNAWREAPMYSERERAALLWTEVVTRLEHEGVPDHVYESVRRSFSEEELMALTLAVVEINGWNRFAIAFRFVPGSYQPAKVARKTASA